MEGTILIDTKYKETDDQSENLQEIIPFRDDSNDYFVYTTTVKDIPNKLRSNFAYIPEEKLKERLEESGLERKDLKELGETPEEMSLVEEDFICKVDEESEYLEERPFIEDLYERIISKTGRGGSLHNFSQGLIKGTDTLGYLIELNYYRWKDGETKREDSRDCVTLGMKLNTKEYWEDGETISFLGYGVGTLLSILSVGTVWGITAALDLVNAAQRYRNDGSNEE